MLSFLGVPNPKKGNKYCINAKLYHALFARPVAKLDWGRCYISTPADQKTYTKIVLFHRYFMKKWGSGVLPPENFFDFPPSRKSENALLQNII